MPPRSMPKKHCASGSTSVDLDWKPRWIIGSMESSESIACKTGLRATHGRCEVGERGEGGSRKRSYRERERENEKNEESDRRKEIDKKRQKNRT